MCGATESQGCPQPEKPESKYASHTEKIASATSHVDSINLTCFDQPHRTWYAPSSKTNGASGHTGGLRGRSVACVFQRGTARFLERHSGSSYILREHRAHSHPHRSRSAAPASKSTEATVTPPQLVTAAQRARSPAIRSLKCTYSVRPIESFARAPSYPEQSWSTQFQRVTGFESSRSPTVTNTPLPSRLTPRDLSR